MSYLCPPHVRDSVPAVSSMVRCLPWLPRVLHVNVVISVLVSGISADSVKHVLPDLAERRQDTFRSVAATLIVVVMTSLTPLL